MAQGITTKRKSGGAPANGGVTPSRRSGPPEKSHKIRIKTWVFIAMLAVSIVADLISLIPAANDAVAIVAGVVFGLWWWFLGLGFLNLKKVITYVVSIVAEFIPFVSILPMITVAVIVTFVISRTEDKLGISLKVSNKFRAAPISKARKMGFKEKVGFLAEGNKREVVMKKPNDPKMRLIARKNRENPAT